MTGAETKGVGSEKNRGEGKGQIEWRIAYVACRNSECTPAPPMTDFAAIGSE